MLQEKGSFNQYFMNKLSKHNSIANLGKSVELQKEKQTSALQSNRGSMMLSAQKLPL
jgi:hypothetical protein